MSIALGRLDGEKADVPRRKRITDPEILRSRAIAYYRQRLEGLTDSEIAKYWGRSRWYINRWINALTPEQKAEARHKRLRAIRADELLREEEFLDA